jgi:tRNA(Ile)-lysidine synthase
MGPVPVVATIRRAVRGALSDLSAGQLVLVACSGGTDSLALASTTAFVAPRLGLRYGALVVDHRLQAGSDRTAAATARTLTEMGFDPVDVLTVTVGAAGGPEAAARDARYAALDAAGERLDAAAILLGHTRDDQAETVLLGLARGSGARSLAGMPAAFGRYRRPLLDLPRSSTAAVCDAQQLRPWDDPHNADPSFTRARVRHAALPALADALGPGIPEALARTARMLREDTAALDAGAEDAASAAALGDGEWDVDRLAALPTAVRRRVLRLAALAAGCPGGTLAAVHIEAVDALLTNWRGQGPLHLPGPVVARRAAGRLAFVAGALVPAVPEPAVAARRATVPVPAGARTPAVAGRVSG